MIDVILDTGKSTHFCNDKNPLIEVNELNSYSIDAYKELAKNIITDYAKENVIVIKINNSDISLNKLALFLFISSIILPNKIEYVVFKVEDIEDAKEKYKPYVALTIGIKYALTLTNETPKNIYKNISELGYLDIKSSRDYILNSMTLSLSKGKGPVQTIKIDNLQDTITYVAILKALSLSQKDVNIELQIDITEEETPLNNEQLIEKIISEILPWIN